jgi:hypothetical protein
MAHIIEYRAGPHWVLDLPDLASLFGRPEWMDRGACCENDASVQFFPDLGGDLPGRLPLSACALTAR